MSTQEIESGMQTAFVTGSDAGQNVHISPLSDHSGQFKEGTLRREISNTLPFRYAYIHKAHFIHETPSI